LLELAGVGRGWLEIGGGYRVASVNMVTYGRRLMDNGSCRTGTEKSLQFVDIFFTVFCLGAELMRDA
jgi:hypothetical protein